MGDAAVVLQLIGQAQAFVPPIARLREEVLPSDLSVAGRIETEPREAIHYALAWVKQAAGMGDAFEEIPAALRDAECLVGTVGLAPGEDFLASVENYARVDAARIHGRAHAVEQRRIVVVHTTMGEFGGRVAGSGDFVGLREGDCFGEVVHGNHDRQRQECVKIEQRTRQRRARSFR